MPPRKLLLATDLDRRTDRAMDRASALATEWNAGLVVAHAIEGSLDLRVAPSEARTSAMRRIRDDLQRPAPAELELVVDRGDAVDLVLDTIKRLDCELVITGVARESAFGRTSAGATVDALARLSPVPVLAVKTRPNRPYRNIVVATDFSESSREALLVALAMFPSANIVLLHAYHVLYEGFMDDKCAAREAEARQADDKAREFLANTAIGDRTVHIRSEHGSPQHALRQLAAGGGVDLVVVGTRGRGPLARLLLGSVARSIVAEVPVDVLVASNAVMTT